MTSHQRQPQLTVLRLSDERQNSKELSLRENVPEPGCPAEQSRLEGVANFCVLDNPMPSNPASAVQGTGVRCRPCHADFSRAYGGRRISFGAAVIKELVQNADDAGASELVLTLDERVLASAKTLAGVQTTERKKETPDSRL